ncbi:MAG: MFS transporter [Candidatus Lokiarchaeota archaeon]|nr:MFS transporter [Candidatus Lokiarchaeota archaeon]
MNGTVPGPSPRRPRFAPVYFLAFSGDLLGSLLIVACVLVGTRLGVEDWIIGVLGSSYGVSYMFSAAAFGHVSDKIGRRRSLLITSAGFSAVSAILVAFPNVIALLVIGQVAIGLLYGFWWSSIEAYISENTAGADHQRKVNNFCISWSLGYMMGPFLGPLLSLIGAVYSFSLLLAFSIANLVVINCFIRPVARSPINSAQGMPQDVARVNGQGAGNLAIPSAILILLIFIYAFTKSFFIGLFPDIAISRIGFSEVETSEIGLAFGLARTAAFVIQNRMRSKSIALRVAIALLLSLTCYLFLLTTDFPSYLVFVSVMGVFSGMLYTTTLELLLQLNEQRKGRTAGFFEASIGIGTFLSPVIGSSVLGFGYAASYAAVATVSTAIATIAIALYAVQKRRKTKETKTRAAVTRSL